MIGLALEGGADRCAFTAGVVDTLMQHQFYASAASGTSAGAGCVLNYRSKQPGLFRQMMLMQNEKPYFGITFASLCRQIAWRPVVRTVSQRT